MRLRAELDPLTNQKRLVNGYRRKQCKTLVVVCDNVQENRNARCVRRTPSGLSQNVAAAEIQRQICGVYIEQNMGDSMVRRWVSQFIELWNSLLDEERSGRQSFHLW